MKKFNILFFFLFADAVSVCNAQWVETTGPYGGTINCFAVSSNGIDTNLFTGTERGVFLSTNNGTNWTAVNTGLTDTSVLSLAVSGANLFAGTGNITTGGIFLSANSGMSWTEVYDIPSVQAIAVTGTNLFAGTLRGLYLSTNNGTLWTITGLTKPVRRIAVTDTNLFAYYGLFLETGILLSNDNGVTWTPVNNGLGRPIFVRAFAVSGTNIFAGTDGGVFLLTNKDTSWTQINTGLTNTNVLSLVINGTNLFAGTYGGVFLSTNNGTSWTEVNDSLENTGVSALAVIGSYLFAGTEGSGIWRRRLSEMIVTHVGNESHLSNQFTLYQNYPNPFNPTTIICYNLPGRTNVTLKIFSILGEEVATLVDEEKEAGRYEIEFKADNLASGVYIYRINAGKFLSAKKLLLMK